MDWSGFSWILLTHWLIRFLTNTLHCSLHYMYLLCDADWRAGQHEPNRGPHNLLRTCLRAAFTRGRGDCIHQNAIIYKQQILCFVDPASLHNLFQMKPARCTLLLNIFISTSLHVSGKYVPIIRRTYCIYAQLVFFPL